jgi:hypothetical protein
MIPPHNFSNRASKQQVIVMSVKHGEPVKMVISVLVMSFLLGY